MWLKKAGLKIPAFFWFISSGVFRSIMSIGMIPAQEKMISRYSAGHKFRSFNQGIFSITLLEIG